jgi:Rieske 2Fe-2S family protein
MAHRLVPIDVDRTLIECEWLWAPESLDDPGFDPAYAVDFWDLTNHEDWGACQRIQKATANRGFSPGPLSPWETSLYQFLFLLGKAYSGSEMSPPVPPSNRIVPIPSLTRS